MELFFTKIKQELKILLKVINILQIQILDDDFNSIDFNSTEWQITLQTESLKYNLYIENATL